MCKLFIKEIESLMKNFKVFFYVELVLIYVYESLSVIFLEFSLCILISK